MRINANLIDDYLWRVKRYLMQRHGCDAADREIDPLTWYVTTGRATILFLENMVAKKPYTIGRLLHKGGSYDETIERIANYIGA